MVGKGNANSSILEDSGLAIPAWEPLNTLLYPVHVPLRMKLGCVEDGLTYYWTSENPSLTVAVVTV